MCSLFERFEAPPQIGWVTVLEKDCQFLSCESSEAEVNSRYTPNQTGLESLNSGLFYGDIWVRKEVGRGGQFGSGDNFLPSSDDESYWKKTWNKWWEQGTIATLQGLQSQEEDGESSPFPLQVVGCILRCAKKVQSIYGLLSPQSQMSTDDLISRYCGHSNWLNTLVRAVALHPRLNYLALARQDDEVDVRDLADEHRVVLRDRQQVGVSCMQWAPHCDSLLAVGASTGLLLWHIDPTSPSTRFVSAWVRYESSPGHTPITSLSWSPWGNFIVSSCPRDNNLMLWDIPLGVGTRVTPRKRGGVANVSWSPDGRRVFAGNVTTVFHVWKTEKWRSERWQNFKGRCKSGCWSSGGEVLLFALEKDPSLYYISFQATHSTTTAIKCADLSPCKVLQEIVIGGEIQAMAWDPTSQRLALTFTVDSPSAELVAIFRTRRSELLEVLPGGFVRGRDGEHPHLIAFKPSYSHGALLVVVWSSGRVSFIPLLFYNHTSSSDVVSLPDLVPNSTPSSHPLSVPSHTPSSYSHYESLQRPSLNRNFEPPTTPARLRSSLRWRKKL